MTLNQGAERIAYALGEPTNYVLKENIKFSIINYRATFMRRDIAANGMSDEFLQKFHADLIKVDKADDCSFTIDCTVLRTKNKIPKPVRIKSDVVFKFVGTPHGKPFVYTEFEEFKYRCFNKYTGNEVAYSYINNYLYFFNANHLKKAALQYAVADPRLVNLCQEDCYDDDMEFPMAEDLMSDIIRNILSGEFKILNPKDEQVKVDVEDDK